VAPCKAVDRSGREGRVAVCGSTSSGQGATAGGGREGRVGVTMQAGPGGLMRSVRRAQRRWRAHGGSLKTWPTARCTNPRNGCFWGGIRAPRPRRDLAWVHYVYGPHTRPDCVLADLIEYKYSIGSCSATCRWFKLKPSQRRCATHCSAFVAEIRLPGAWCPGTVLYRDAGACTDGAPLLNRLKQAQSLECPLMMFLLAVTVHLKPAAYTSQTLTFLDTSHTHLQRQAHPG